MTEGFRLPHSRVPVLFRDGTFVPEWFRYLELIRRHISEMTQAGTPIAVGHGSYAANADITTPLPADDTVPTSSEGAEIITVSHTTRAAANKVMVRAVVFGSHSAGGVACGIAVNRGGASAIGAAWFTPQGAGGAPDCGVLEFEDTPGLGSFTYALRVGPASGTMRLNGTTAIRYGGGVAKCTLTLTEVIG